MNDLSIGQRSLQWLFLFSFSLWKALFHCPLSYTFTARTLSFFVPLNVLCLFSSGRYSQSPRLLHVYFSLQLHLVFSLYQWFEQFNYVALWLGFIFHEVLWAFWISRLEFLSNFENFSNHSFKYVFAPPLPQKLQLCVYWIAWNCPPAHSYSLYF